MRSDQLIFESLNKGSGTDRQGVVFCASALKLFAVHGANIVDTDIIAALDFKFLICVQFLEILELRLDVLFHFRVCELEIRLGKRHIVNIKSLDIILDIDAFDRSIVIEHCTVICGSYSLVLFFEPLSCVKCAKKRNDCSNNYNREHNSFSLVPLCLRALVFDALALCLTGTHAFILAVLLLSHNSFIPPTFNLLLQRVRPQYSWSPASGAYRLPS